MNLLITRTRKKKFNLEQTIWWPLSGFVFHMETTWWPLGGFDPGLRGPPNGH
jgi:hypothetical protein